MFRSARLKLTLWYLVMIVIVSGVFSAMIYSVQVTELDRFVRLQRFRTGRYVDPDLVDESKQRLAIFLLLTDFGILVMAGAASYFLAGRTLSPIAQMMEEQNQFVGDASHELRTPLAALKSAFEVNRRDRKLTISAAKALLADGIGEVDKLSALADKLLKLAQYQEQNGKKRIEKVAMEQVIAEAVGKVKSMAGRKKIKIDIQTNEATIKGDYQGLVDLTVILLDNAIKYSQGGKAVTVETKQTDGTVILTVKDQGVGISPRDLPHIFDRFYRADSARTSGGYGLGLAIAKKIATENGGEISASSKVGVGSEFQVVFRNDA